MDAVTYPNEQVIQFINRHFASVRIEITSKPLPQQFRATWTPTFLVLDEHGDEHHRSVGFLASEEFTSSMLLGIGKSFFDREEYDEATEYFSRVIEDYAASDSAAEAVYYRGVAKYKKTHDAEALRETSDLLRAGYPDSEWAKRASVYQLL